MFYFLFTNLRQILLGESILTYSIAVTVNTEFPDDYSYRIMEK